MAQSGEAVEADFYISSYSGGSNCVAVARLADGEVAVRHSRRPELALVFRAEEWAAFVSGVKAAEFDL